MTLAEVINEGLPRAAWSTIATRPAGPARLSLAYTLLLCQTLLGFILALVLVSSSHSFTDAFVPELARAKSITYVRISSFSALSSAVEAAVAAASRALDQPDVPLILSSAKFAINIILDLLLISTFHVTPHDPTVEMQAGIQLTCNMVAALLGILYFVVTNASSGKDNGISSESAAPRYTALKILIRPGLITFAESAVRNVLYLWLVSTIVSLGSTYATAWGVFNTIRWGLVMVPVSALEATTLAFVGHAWGRCRRQTPYSRMSFSSLCGVVQPALISVGLALAFEIPLCVGLSAAGSRAFARYLSGSDAVAKVTEHMWRSLDWCYVLYAVSTQLAAILLATRPKWYLWQSLASNILYVLPWAIVCQAVRLDEGNAWTYHALVFGGSLVFSFICVPVVVGLWGWLLWSGRTRLPPLR
ncbi:hypothetical protein JDV02_004868 [Purpureocillium takamizusanense]|uniref:Uncharacterized protein n=1 Tax=Purpureocillium takamizusanense TaxID=2060973 RepID=A0A9Q8QFH1_9HYPO|nr:uncharacterized protein JDV02_004868 [Purpureocillium takamizusanense]UNI18613.1 hypothetical protein JDV02_004868 [Purpureocillium takamizusanense]